MSNDEDYMSNEFLSKVEDIKPGVSSIRAAQRFLRINARNEALIVRKRDEKSMSKMEMEKNRLEEGIKKPIESENRGFQLLAKMGYKPGMSLGRAREGQCEPIKEPIAIQMRANRSGVGHDEEQQERQKERCEAHMERMQKRARMEQELTDDFVTRKRFLTIQKELISDIQRIRRACQEMDIRLGKDNPEEFWFWPIYSLKNQQEEIPEEEIRGPADLLNKNEKKRKLAVMQKEEEEDEITFTYSNGQLTQMDINFWKMEESELNNSLERIIAYMRSVHFYCIWCGCSYDDEDDISTNCPGITRSDH